MKKNIIILSAVLFTLAACQPKAVEPETMFLTEEQAMELMQSDPNGYIYYDADEGGLNQFVADYMTEEGDYDYVRYRSKKGDNYLFSIDSIPTAGKGIYIRGRITTDDAGGNFYKALVIQQMVYGKQQALRISLDMGNASGMYALGQEILIRVNGLAIGRYADQPQLCVPAFNNNVNAGHFDEKVGWAPGRIPAAKFRAATTRIGYPDPSLLQYDEIDISTLVTTSDDSKEGYGKSLIDLVTAREWDGKLVILKGFNFTSEYADTKGKRMTCSTGNPEEDTNANVFGPTTDNQGYPQSRVISNGSLYFMVSTSEYAKYSHMFLPSADYKGNIKGILGFYMDNAAYDASWKSWSVTPRDISDIVLYNGTELWTPVEYGTKTE